MWEKAFIGDDGSQVRRKRPVRPCGLTSKGLSLCLFELNYRIRGRTLRDESLETNTARDLKQVVRMFVEMDVGPVSPSSTTWYEKKRLETNHWTGVTQGTWNKSCGYYGKWTSFLLFRVRMPRIYKDVRHRAQKWNVGPERRKERETFCKILHSAKDLGVGIANCIGI